MMMMMMKKKKGSLAVVALLVASVNCILHPSKEDLTRKFHCNPTYKKNSFLLCVFLLEKQAAVGTFKCIFFNAVNMKRNTDCLHYIIHNI